MKTKTGIDRSQRATQVKLATVLVSFAAVTVLVVATSRAAFNAQTTNGSSSLATGTVVLSDDDSDSIMFDNLTGLKPGSTATKCVNVSYTGTLTADVKLYGSVGGTGLASYVDTVIDVGTGATGGSTLSCSGFSGSNLHTGTLAAFGTANSNYSNGLGGFSGATNPTTKSYRVQVTVQDNASAQGKTATFTLTWEAQNT